MSVKSTRAGYPSSKFNLGDKVKTPSGLVGEIIGLAEYALGWEYRIKVPGKKQTMYRPEHKLTLVMKGSAARRDYLNRQSLKPRRR